MEVTFREASRTQTALTECRFLNISVAGTFRAIHRRPGSLP